MKQPQEERDMRAATKRETKKTKRQAGLGSVDQQPADYHRASDPVVPTDRWWVRVLNFLKRI